MLYVLIFTILFAVVSSAICSVMEAALYAVPVPLVKHLADQGTRRGKVLLQLKSNIERPITAILILNTIANTAGASVAGWAYGEVWGARFGELGLLAFSSIFIALILIFSEITPKILGVVYCRKIAPVIALPLYWLTKLFTLPIGVAAVISSRLRPENEAPTISYEEVLSMAQLGTEEGALDHFEGSIIKNVIGLDQLLVRDVLTPRVVVLRLNENLTLSEIANQVLDWNHSRVPLYAEDEPDHLKSYVNQRDIFRKLLTDEKDVKLKDVARPLEVVPELMRVDKLLLKMFERREQICAVVDEHGSLAGIITLEDLIEELLGREIVDEYDAVSDLRLFARLGVLIKKGRGTETAG